MIVGAFLKNFKAYKNFHFLPLSSDGRANFCCLIGMNGVGKSSILEALDCFFNPESRDWVSYRNIGPDSPKDGPIIAPIFLVKKSEMGKLKTDEASILESLSEYFWTVQETHFGSFMNEFYKLRDGLASEFAKTDYYLILAGKGAPSLRSLNFISFETQIRDRILKLMQIDLADNEAVEAFVLADVVKKPCAKVVGRYQYFYIPVETDPTVYSKLEEREVQLLMDEKIKEKVVGFIKPDLVNDINSELKTYLEGIQEHLVDYIYKPERQKEKLTSADFAEKIVDAYFATKKLHYKKSEKQLVPVSDLSSGEKRRALIDVAYAFLKKRSPSDSHQVVLAIDEPDASLHISACYDQFEKVKDISRQGHQTLVATHWYGFLPVAESGIGHAIEKDIHDAVTVTSFDLYEYSSSIKNVVKASKNAVPVDVHLKSYNDLVQSVVASVLHERPYRWIFCEGLSDKIYLEHFLALLSKKPEQTSRLRIVPLGGAKEVRRVFQYLERPLTDDSYTINGRIVCLIDTDAQMLRVTPVNSPKANLEFRRLLLTENNTKISLEKGDSSQVAPETTIEDCLPGNAFQTTLKKFVSKYPALTPIVAKAKEGKALLAGGINLDKVQIATLKSFFEMDNGAMKVEFAKAFVLINKDIAEIPDWIKELKKLLPEFKPKT